jgi:signal transduction histidine kinase
MEPLLLNILKSVSRCDRIIETSEIMEDIMKIDLHKRSLRKAVHDALVQVVQTQDVEVHATLELGDVFVQADKYLDQMLFAILDNACIHNRRNNKAIWVNTTETHDGYTVTICDNGPGISDDTKSQLLNMEQRSGGLGLHLCRLIADKYNANISISDRVEGISHHGTRVEIWFPKVA